MLGQDLLNEISQLALVLVSACKLPTALECVGDFPKSLNGSWNAGHAAIRQSWLLKKSFVKGSGGLCREVTSAEMSFQETYLEHPFGDNPTGLLVCFVFVT